MPHTLGVAFTKSPLIGLNTAALTACAKGTLLGVSAHIRTSYHCTTDPYSAVAQVTFARPHPQHGHTWDCVAPKVWGREGSIMPGITLYRHHVMDSLIKFAESWGPHTTTYLSTLLVVMTPQATWLAMPNLSLVRSPGLAALYPHGQEAGPPRESAFPIGALGTFLCPLPDSPSAHAHLHLHQHHQGVMATWNRLAQLDQVEWVRTLPLIPPQPPAIAQALAAPL